MTPPSIYGRMGLTPPTPQPKCLFIGPMKGDDTPTRERFETVFEKIVKPAAKDVGMDATNASADGPCMITSKIFTDIRNAHVIVADMTGENTSVGYELAFAHFLAKCTVLLVKGEGKLPFDLRDMNRIKFETEDSSSLKRAAIDLAKHMRDFAEQGWVSASNPIFHAAYAPPEATPVNHYQNALAAIAKPISPPSANVLPSQLVPPTPPSQPPTNARPWGPSYYHSAESASEYPNFEALQKVLGTPGPIKLTDILERFKRGPIK